MQPVNWYLNRLSLMSPGEVLWRVTQKVTGRFLRPTARSRRQSARPSIEVLNAWPAPGGVVSAPYVAAAEEILAGRFDLFGNAVDVGFPDTRWHRDPVSGREAPLKTGFALDYRDAGIVGSARDIWEVNRHFQLVALAQAWALTHDARYADGARALMQSWLHRCPYPLGINWSSALECGIRLINWYIASRILGWWEGGREPVPGMLDAIRQHCHFIWQRRSRFSSANNHLIGEMAGLYCAAAAWPCWPESAGWRARAREILEREAARQVHADGVSCEQSVSYQAFVMQLLLIAGLVGNAAREPFPDRYWRVFRRMGVFLRSVADGGGHLPDFGDSDDGMAFVLSPQARAERFSDLARLERRFDGHVDRDRPGAAEWLAAGFPAPAGWPRQTEQRQTEFPAGGYFVLHAHRDQSEEARVVFDAAPLGYLSIAAHGHADCLSFVLSLGGEPVLVDPGTCCYHEDPIWRSYFRGTSAHNTLRVDGVDQSEPGGPFMWLQKARPVLEFARTHGPVQRVRARHDGYRRLADAVVHTREVKLDGHGARVEVLDVIEAREGHRLERFWHFAPGCEVRRQRAGLVLITLPHVQVHLRCDDAETLRVLRGSQAPRGGWFSPGFGRLEETTTLVFRNRSRGATTLRTVIDWEFRD